MAPIVRPEKPPLLPAQQAALVAAVQAAAGGNNASGYTPEDMPIDVMSTGPAQPVAPQTEQVVVIPSDPGTPNVPGMTVRGPEQDTRTPQIVDMPTGDGATTVTTAPAVPADPATAEITTDDVMGDKEEGNYAIPATLAALGLTAALYARYKKTGTTGDPTMDQTIRDVGTEGIDKAGGGIDNIDGSETRAGKAATGDATDATGKKGTGPVVGSTTDPTQPAPPKPTDTPDTTFGPAAGDPATSEIGTDDVMGQVSDEGNTRMTVLDGAPPGMPNDHPGNIYTATNSRDKTLLSYVKGGDGQWYALDPIRATPQALRDQRSVITNAMRSVRGALR